MLSWACILAILAVCLSVCLLLERKKEGVVVFTYLLGLLKIHFGLEPVLRCEPSTYQSISYCIIKASIEE